MIYIGIDPGLQGAVATIDSSGAVLDLWDAPTVAAARGGELNVPAMSELLRQVRGAGDCYCVIEQVSTPRTASGASSPRNALKIGYGLGTWVGILAAHGIAYEIIEPLIWKRFLKVANPDLTDTQRKQLAKRKAMELCPSHAADFGKRRADVAEAYLLAVYAQRRHRGETK